MDPSAPLDGEKLDQLWDFADPDTSARRFRAELARTPTSFVAHQELRTQLARALGLLQLEHHAVAELDAVGAAGAARPRVTARVELERGRLHNSRGRTAQAISHFKAATVAARAAADDFLLADAFHMLAIADAVQSEAWTRAGIAVADQASDPRTRRWIGALCNNFGWSLHDRGDFAGALEQFERAREAYRRDGSTEQRRVADWAVARCLRSLGRYGEALTIQLELEAGSPDGYVQEELAELLLATGSPQDATPHFARAAAMLDADLGPEEPHRLARLRLLGGVLPA